MDNSSRIAKNIHDLRKAYGETQKELGRAIEVEESTISMYESGKRLPDINTIKAIAKHYRLPVDRLMHDDCADMDLRSTSITLDKIWPVLNIIFPLVCSEASLQNSHFASGYKRSVEICKKLQNELYITRNSIELAIEDYNMSLPDRTVAVDAAANLLWIIFFVYMLIPDEYSTSVGEAILLGKGKKTDFTKRFILRDSDSIHSENISSKREFARDSLEEITDLLRVLKESDQYSDLAYYYASMLYIMGMIDNDYSDDLNQTIGIEMLSSYAMLGNKYALNFLKECKLF